MNILVVDDEELQLIRFKNKSKSVIDQNSELCLFSNPIEALNKAKMINFEIAFLDIEMPGLNGIQLAKELKKNNPKINIIFVTAYDNYALDAYKIHASGYLSKPVSSNKIKEELESLRYQNIEIENNKIQVKCFGNFEIFYNGKPLKFTYQKSKEVFAYLIDREGSSITVNELNAVLWEEDHKSYLRNLLVDIKKSLKAINASDVLIKIRNGYSIDVNKIYCDAYEYKKGNPNAIRMYRGEYMIQYPWARFKE